jgi:hypothetical protein
MKIIRSQGASRTPHPTIHVLDFTIRHIYPTTTHHPPAVVISPHAKMSKSIPPPLLPARTARAPSKCKRSPVASISHPVLTCRFAFDPMNQFGSFNIPYQTSVPMDSEPTAWAQSSSATLDRIMFESDDAPQHETHQSQTATLNGNFPTPFPTHSIPDTKSIMNSLQPYLEQMHKHIEKNVIQIIRLQYLNPSLATRDKVIESNRYETKKTLIVSSAFTKHWPLYSNNSHC